MRCVGRTYRRVQFLIRITDIRSLGRGYTLRGRPFSALQDGGGFISTACEHHYVNVVVSRTGAAAVGLRTGLLEEWALDRIGKPLQAALILEWATNGSPLSGGHESRIY